MTEFGPVSAGELDELAATVRDFCRKSLPQPTLARPATIRDADAARAHWKRLAAEVGLGSLLVPEAFDGAGASLVEAGRVAEALGAELAAVPFLSTAVLAPVLLSSLAGDDPESPAGKLLGRIADGTTVAAVAWATDDPGTPSAELVITDGTTATGSFGYVIDADLADVVLLVGAGGEQIAVAGVGDLEITPRQSFDLTRGFADVRAEAAPVEKLGSGAAARTAFERMLAAGRLVAAAESAGGAQAALDQAVEYARQRVQFGREIGSFQSIKHILADCYVATESTISTARLAIDAYAAGTSEAAELVSLASFYCADKFADVAAAGIQVHGGIGFTAECSAHLFRRRAESNRLILGDPARLRAEYVQLLATQEVSA
ncbi:alkylation response protein AidB-like acyl-CoA dehydrogenase [Antricoccus suffuscus]|uniref:Alkylation response protein AidB-like acyl-CoA dehydrogenase n=1 Tax=Antricoccus suffuscus TaxID=1629062 RepID=A0A2T0ZY31_9ACTN|nr:acyl-CoA dehydrogenase family protein [Antricoccus suffuscus]PRZ41250.1 alkylation response protein AidB-like acyl-CoA dehydrogenase [Antricoccus suffuscus]